VLVCGLIGGARRLGLTLGFTKNEPSAREEISMSRKFAVSWLFALFIAPMAFAGGITMEQYRKVEPGMTYEQVIAILGAPDQELSRSDMAGYTTVMYMWEGKSMGANMNAMFQNNSLVNKAQFGLR
jgi:hypothetical protein